MKTLICLSILLSSSLFASNLTVSGISSGAYIAQQFHTAFSSQVSGVGIIAGGPYYCAKGNIVEAMNKCMKTVLGSPRTEDSILMAKELAKAGKIDPLENLSHSKVWMLSGTKDRTVDQKVADALRETYKSFGVADENLVYINDLKIGHAFPTDNFGNDCRTVSRSPFISNCGLDGAGAILKQLLGKLNPKQSSTKEHLYHFDQLRFATDNKTIEKLSMHQLAYVYIPEGCEEPGKANCPIHIAFHGCKQTLDHVQTTFIEKSGYNDWAEANRIVVLYPQAKRSALPNNPNGCWDWWGYTGSNYHTKDGAQMKVVMKMVKALKQGKLKLTSAD